MKWLELSIKTPPEFVEPLSHIFYRYGHGGVAVEQGGGFNPDEGESPIIPSVVTVKTYLPIDSTTQDLRNRIDLGVRLVAHLSTISPLEEKVLDEQEWENSWKEHFDILRIGNRMVICPTWLEHKASEREIVINLDPGMAFGTGHHPTTRMCLEQLEKMVHTGLDVLDMGGGSGILSIAAAKLGSKRVHCLDIDMVAVEAAKENVRANGMESKIQIVHGALPHPAIQFSTYDIAVANISSKVLIEASEDLVRVVRPGGNLILSGIMASNVGRTKRALYDTGVKIEQQFVDGDWVTLVGLKP